jgi:hypothetical protein
VEGSTLGTAEFEDSGFVRARVVAWEVYRFSCPLLVRP